jgi:hypothetical protein
VPISPIIRSRTLYFRHAHSLTRGTILSFLLLLLLLLSSSSSFQNYWCMGTAGDTRPWNFMRPYTNWCNSKHRQTHVIVHGHAFSRVQSIHVWTVTSILMHNQSLNSNYLWRSTKDNCHYTDASRPYLIQQTSQWSDWMIKHDCSCQDDLTCGCLITCSSSRIVSNHSAVMHVFFSRT